MRIRLVLGLTSVAKYINYCLVFYRFKKKSTFKIQKKLIVLNLN